MNFYEFLITGVLPVILMLLLVAYLVLKILA